MHRDLKPGNIMIDREGNAKIMDFGIAKTPGPEATTVEGAIIGTPEYMSPEQVEGKKADGRADIYSLGIILFEMVTGRMPFGGETSLAIAHKHKSSTLPIHGLNPEVPEDLSRVILRCLEKEREARYQTTAELTDLGSVERASPATANGSVELGHKAQAQQLKRFVNITPKSPCPLLTLVADHGSRLIRFLPQKRSRSPLFLQTFCGCPLSFRRHEPEKSYRLCSRRISDALTINSLHSFQDLHVPGRTSAFFFEQPRLDVHDIGRKIECCNSPRRKRPGYREIGSSRRSARQHRRRISALVGSVQPQAGERLCHPRQICSAIIRT